MITFRHFLTTIVAVFLALAVGIVLGGGPLADVGDDPQRTVSATEDVAPGAAEAYGEGFAGAVAPTLVAERLAERPVAVVTVPGVDETVLTATAEMVQAAGGVIAGRYALTEQMVSPDQKSLVDQLGAQLMTQQADVPAEATTYDRVGQLLGLAVATTTAEGDSPSAKQSGLVESLVGADLLQVDGEVATRAPLVLLVLGAEPAPEGGDAILAGLATGLSRAAAGVVVAGTLADGGAGQVGRLRAEPVSAEVATVDGIDTQAGRVATALALARSMDTAGGAFGATGADGTVPLG